jgi:hypothetical protein
MMGMNNTALRNSQKSLGSPSSTKRAGQIPADERMRTMKEHTINSILKKQARDSPDRKSDRMRYKTEHIITNGEGPSVEGIDIPISGSCSGKGTMFHTIEQHQLRQDTMKSQVTISDMVKQIKQLERLHPQFPSGVQGAEKEKELLVQDQRQDHLESLSKLKNQTSLSVGFASRVRHDYATIAHHAHKDGKSEFGSFQLANQQEFKDDFNTTHRVENPKLISPDGMNRHEALNQTMQESLKKPAVDGAVNMHIIGEEDDNTNINTGAHGLSGHTP